MLSKLLKKTIAWVVASLLALLPATAFACSTSTAFDVSDRIASAIHQNGELFMWGRNENGEFGNGQTFTPSHGDNVQFVKTADGIKQTILGTYASAYTLTEDGTVYASGKNTQGEMGNGEQSYDAVTTPVEILNDVVRIGAGSEYALALKSDGTLWGWGALSGLRLGEISNSGTPVKIYEDVKYFACGADFCALITNSDKLYTAGNGAHGKTGVPQQSAEDVNRQGFTFVADNIKYVSCGKYNMYAVDGNGALYSCGRNMYGELLNGTVGESVYPLTQVISSGVKSAVCYESDAVYITENGELYGTGNNLYNQLGHTYDSSIDCAGTIFKIAEHVTDAAVGAMNILYRTTDGSLYMTGAYAEAWGISFGGHTKVLADVAQNVQPNTAEPANGETVLQINSNKMNVGGTEYTLDVPAQILDGRTMVPLRAIFEKAIGATVDWDNDTQTVTAQKDGIEIKLTIGDKYIYKNGEPSALDVPAQVISGRTLAPARAVAEAFVKTVEWVEQTQTVIIK